VDSAGADLTTVVSSSASEEIRRFFAGRGEAGITSGSSFVAGASSLGLDTLRSKGGLNGLLHISSNGHFCIGEGSWYFYTVRVEWTRLALEPAALSRESAPPSYQPLSAALLVSIRLCAALCPTLYPLFAHAHVLHEIARCTRGPLRFSWIDPHCDIVTAQWVEHKRLHNEKHVKSS
jgi:hypothetical protein